MATQEQIESFYRFATERLANGGAGMSMDELYDDWRLANPTPDEHEEDVAAIQVAIDNLKKGAKCRDAREISREMREKLS